MKDKRTTNRATTPVVQSEGIFKAYVLAYTLMKVHRLSWWKTSILRIPCGSKLSYQEAQRLQPIMGDHRRYASPTGAGRPIIEVTTSAMRL